MTKSELHDVKVMVEKVKAEVVVRGMPYARVRALDDALRVIDQVMIGRDSE